jgi:hypothetical protein
MMIIDRLCRVTSLPSRTAVGTLALILHGTSVTSAAELYKVPGTQIDFTAEIGFGGFAINQDYTSNARRNVNWTEGYAVMGLKFDHDLTSDGVWKAFGAVSGVVNGNRGDGDAAGFQIGTENDGDILDAYGGIMFAPSGEDGPSVRISGGRQKISIGDRFLIDGENFTAGEGFGEIYDEGGAVYLNPRRNFAETVFVQLESGGAWRADGFYIGSDKAIQGDVKLLGANIEYGTEDFGKLAFMYIRGLEADNAAILPPGTLARDGVNILSFSGDLKLGVKDLSLAFNYVDEFNNSQPTGVAELDAWAWYVMPSYTFSQSTWTPNVYYRFASFSGDDPDTATNEAFDPLFYGFQGYNTWFIGEIAANYSGPFNANADVHSLGIKWSPAANIGIGTLDSFGAYANHYTLRNPETFLTATADDFGTEVGFFAEMTLFENVYVSPAYAVLSPGEGYSSSFGNDDIVHSFSMYGILTY